MNITPQALCAPSHEAMEQAAAWFSLFQSGSASEADHERWQAWLASGAECRAAWVFVERVSQRFAPLQTVSAPRLAADALQVAHRRVARRRTLLLGIAALAGLGSVPAVLGWPAGGWVDPLAAAFADHRTATGERRKDVLVDGTQVWLASASAFDEDYRPGLRRLRLRAGEILIQTATDTGRPFVVDTACGRLRALGTRFNVRLDDDGGAQLAVYEGAVELVLADTAARSVVRAGQQVAFNAERIEPPTPADLARAVWARGVLLAQDIPLAQVVAELARYRRGHIAVAPEVAGLSVLGSYPVDDVDGTLAMLAQALPIRVEQTLPWWTSIEARGRSSTAPR